MTSPRKAGQSHGLTRRAVAHRGPDDLIPSYRIARRLAYLDPCPRWKTRGDETGRFGKDSIAMPTISDGAHVRPRRQADVTPHSTHPNHERAFDSDTISCQIDPVSGVLFVPVRHVPAPAGPWDCEPEHRHQSADADLGPVVAVDTQTRLGAWRRQFCCGRCVSGIVASHPEATVWWPSERGDVPDGPPEPRQALAWPAELGGAA